MLKPLAERLRPKSLDEYIGQEHLVGEGAVLRRMIESGIMPERKAGEDLMIPAGEYLFMQLPYIPEEKEIPRIILPCITAQEGTFYIRIFKESILECVIQLLFPTY